VDYLSEADVYIRYGMEDEALQQVNMALKLQPDNTEAHIKKADVLRSSNNLKGFEEAVAVAGDVLGGVALERFRSAAVDMKDSDVSADGEIFDHGPDEINEDLSGQVKDILESGDLEGVGEMDWLQDTPQATDDSSLSEAAGQQSDVSDYQGEDQPEAQAEETEKLDAGGATQELDHLLSEFSGDDDFLDETADYLDESVSEQTGQEAEAERATGMDEDFGATQVFENMLDESIFENALKTPDDLSGKTIVLDADHTATQELGSLLNEFSDDDEDEKKK
jgi:hypothetical protein